MISPLTLLAVLAVPAPAASPDANAASELEDWPRPQYREGGGDAFLAYAVFGNLGKLTDFNNVHLEIGWPN